jgi:hypothetical protein
MPAAAAETIAAETEERRWAIPAIAAAGGLPLIATVVAVILLSGPGNGPAGLLKLNDNVLPLTIAAVVQFVGAVSLGAALLFFFHAVKRRRPELRNVFLPMALVGATGYALVGTLQQVFQPIPPYGIVLQGVLNHAVSNFATTGGQTWQESQDLIGSATAAGSQFVELIASFALAASFVVLVINAIRAGLLPKVMGYIGVFAGMLFAIPITGRLPSLVIQGFWLTAFALIVAGRWPGGRPPAWAAGEAIPWPTMQEQREGRGGGGSGRSSRGNGNGKAVAPARPATPAAPRPANPGAARRKRKKRT